MTTGMQYGHVPGVAKKISRIVQGTIQINTGDDAIGFAQMDAAWEAGINAFDTAHVYGGGANDKFLGRWIKARGVRDEMVVLAKGAHHNDVRRRVTPFDIAADLHDTLARMKVEFLDLYVLHRDNMDVPVEPIVDALNRLQKEGKIGAFGGSNWTAARLDAANAYAAASGQTPFAVSSPNFSLADQKKEPWEGCVTISGPNNVGEREWYAQHKMPLFTWSSMAGGFLSGRITPENQGEFTSYFDKLAVECYAAPDNFQRLDRAKKLATEKGLTMPQIALAYVLHYPLDIYALVGSANAEEIAANIVALNTPLTTQEMDYLDLGADVPA
ncbi:MAG: aldo/keto reductase [Chthonomonadaceae bacterium]|nr:aldo/keto reductase [Chthonomonadaceae bacterium]